MNAPRNDEPVDPVADPSLSADPPTESEAVSAAEKMNDPDGAHPDVVEDPPAVSGDDPLPELME